MKHYITVLKQKKFLRIGHLTWLSIVRFLPRPLPLPFPTGLSSASLSESWSWERDIVKLMVIIAAEVVNLMSSDVKIAFS